MVCDAGNGAGGIIRPDLLDRLGFTVVPLYCEPDGTVPNHLAGMRAHDAVLAHCSMDSRPVSQQMKDLPPSMMTPEIRADVAEKDKFRVVDELVKAFQADGEAKGVVTIDGARVSYPEGWGR